MHISTAKNSVSLNLMYNHYFTYRSSFNLGVQAHLDYFQETLGNDTPWLDSSRSYNLDRDEQEVGAYAEYTYAVKDRLSIVAGLRGDYNAFYDRFFLTPRGHVKWNITPSTANSSCRPGRPSVSGCARGRSTGPWHRRSNGGTS